MKRLRLSAILFLFALLITIGCKKNDLTSISQSEKNLSEKLKKFLLENQLSSTNIKELEDFYVVENDIMISKDELKKLTSTKPRQAHTDNTVQGSFTNISIRFDASVSYQSRWYNAVTAAIQEWNEISDCRINFSITSQSTADITIYQSDLGEGWYGSGEIPMVNGKPGSSIYFTNRTQFRQTYPNGPFVTLNYLRDVYTAVHELGHTLGLKHTDIPHELPSAGTNFIPGTPTSNDPASVMNSGGYAASWLKEYSELSQFDITAIRYLYPEPVQYGTIFFKVTNESSYVYWDIIDEVTGNLVGGFWPDDMPSIKSITLPIGKKYIIRVYTDESGHLSLKKNNDPYSCLNITYANGVEPVYNLASYTLNNNDSLFGVYGSQPCY